MDSSVHPSIVVCFYICKKIEEELLPGVDWTNNPSVEWRHSKTRDRNPPCSSAEFVTLETRSSFTEAHRSEGGYTCWASSHRAARTICRYRLTAELIRNEAEMYFTSPLWSSLDIQPFLKLRRSGCEAERRQGHVTSFISMFDRKSYRNSAVRVAGSSKPLTKASGSKK